MQQTFKANDIEIGYHPSGYRIDKAASPMDRYTRWEIDPAGNWHKSVPVCFDSMPKDGWFKTDNQHSTEGK
ncbi:MAG: hypothetical protein JW863_13220 [Chitinispirillaceae bacterium]|nr:hypothetical protein [Chitinispirillaceae bacterium]